MNKEQESNEKQVSYDSVYCKIAKQLMWYGADIHNPGLDIQIKSNQIYLPYSNICNQKKENEILYYIHIIMESNLAIN